MKNRLFLIIDDSDIFLDKKTNEILENWKQDNIYECSTITQWSKGIGNQITMFSKPCIKLDLRDDKNLKNFAELVKNKNKNNLFADNWFENGVIIITNKIRGTSKIVQLVKDSNGVIIQKKTNEEHKKEILNSLKVNNSVKNFISEYIGDDYELLYLIANSINSVKDTSLINLNNIQTFIPAKPGSIPPWDYINCLNSGNIAKANEQLDRVLENTHYLVVVSLLKNFMYNLLLYNIATKYGYKDIKQIAKIYNMKNQWTFLGVSKIRKDLNIKVCEYLLEEICYIEYLLKTGQNTNAEYLLHLYTMRAMLSIKYNTNNLKVKR